MPGPGKFVRDRLITEADLKNRMFYKAPSKWEQEAHKAIQAAAMEFATQLMINCPNPSRELTLSIEKVEEARMWGSAAVAHARGNLCQCGRGYDTDGDGDCPACARPRR